MGILREVFLKGFSEGRQRAKDQSYRNRHDLPVKLVEPSVGRIVELELIEQDDRFTDMYMDLLKTYAESLETLGAKWSVTDKTLKIMFDDGSVAEATRQAWKK